jgi:serine protease Do
VIAARTTLTARRGAFEAPYSGPVYIVDAITNNSGAGGGVLTTWDGKLLGMIGKELRNAETNTWVNYAVPVTELKNVVGQIISGRYETRKPALDEVEVPMRYGPLDFGLVMVPDVLYRTPAYIDDVLPDSPAGMLGLRPDDLILFVNDELIQSCRMLREQLGRLEAGDPLRLIVRRGNVLVAVEMTAMKKEVK